MIKILQGNALHLPLADKSVHCVVTSPPYMGLRVYSGQQETDWPAGKYSPCTGAPACIEVPAMRCALGAESTIESYIWHMLLILRECWRVLRDDGVIWWNLGDAYNSAAGGYYECGDFDRPSRKESRGSRKKIPNNSLDAGNLIGIPARFILAVQSDGWIIRNDCCWQKKSPMPESISGARWMKHRIKVESGDRGREKSRIGAIPSRPQQDHDGKIFKPSSKYIDCPGCDECTPNDRLVLKRGSWRHTRAHEFVFMLTKQMQYWADGDAVREKAAYDGRKDETMKGSRKYISELETGQTVHTMAARGHERWKKDENGERIRNPRSVLSVNTEQEIASMVAAYEFELRATLAENRNPHDVLTPKPSNYKGAHFAVFPPDLIRNLVKSSTPKKCCPKCGAGYAPEVELSGGRDWRNDRIIESLNDTKKSLILGYRPTCDCKQRRIDEFKPIPGTCLDPFAGSGTTLSVCRELGVSGIGIDISFPYLWEQAAYRAEKRVPQEIQEKRIVELPLFANEAKEPFTRLVLDATNGKAELKTVIVTCAHRR
jgi:DNA modification methylase